VKLKNGASRVRDLHGMCPEEWRRRRMQQILDGGEREGVHGRSVLVVGVGAGEGIDVCRHQVARWEDGQSGGNKPGAAVVTRKGDGVFFWFPEAACVWTFGCSMKRARLNSPQCFFRARRCFCAGGRSSLTSSS
jgi:hypothetical protein